MKKIAKLLVVCMMLTLLVEIGLEPSRVYAGSSYLSGPDTVRPGDSITCTLVVNDPGMFCVQGNFSCDGNLALTGVTSANGGWQCEVNGNSFLCYDNNMTSPLGAGTAVISMTFNVSGSVAAGTTVSATVSDLLVTDGNTEDNIGSATYSVAITAPLSGNTRLGSLSVAGQTLSPGFSPDTTSYNLGEVDYEVSSLSISASPEDGTATVYLPDAGLAVGSNSLTITVVAQNGARGYYTINVTRKQDPNYVPSNNARLASIEVSAGILSPAFSADVKKYVVYLPNECLDAAFIVGGTMEDAKAQGVLSGTIEHLVAGENHAVVTGVAEDGTNEVYDVIVCVMPLFEGTLPDITGVEKIEELIPEKEEVTETEEITEEVTEEVEEIAEASKGMGVGPVVGLCILFTVIGAGAGVGGFYVYQKKEKKKNNC